MFHEVSSSVGAVRRGGDHPGPVRPPPGGASPRPRRWRRRLGPSTPTRCWCSSWHRPLTGGLAKRWRGRTLRVLCMDNQWWATPKQRLGVAASHVPGAAGLRTAAFLPSERSADFARRLGFDERPASSGASTAPTTPASSRWPRPGGRAAPRRSSTSAGWCPTRAIDALAEGYRCYRAAAADPVAPAGRWHRPLGVPPARSRRASRCSASSSRTTCPPVRPSGLPGTAEPVRAVGGRHPRGGGRRAPDRLHVGLRCGHPASCSTGTTAWSCARTAPRR